jgi:Ca-activated chloride channel family protein
MRLRNKQFSLSLIVLFLFTVAGGAQNTTPPEAPPRSSQPTSPSAPPTAAPQSSPQQPSAGQEAGNDSGTFVFHSDVEEVLLHATVIDDKQRMVTSLDQNAFTVFEDGKPQVIKSFRHEDIPISLGIVIDNSGSMREKRAKVAKAAVNLVKASNPQDEVFVVNFSDEYYLDQPFTNKINLLQDALEKYETRGGTALYDAVVASADELKKHGKLQKKILFVVTDGEDDASRESLEQAVRRLQEENGPTVYAIGVLGEERQRRAKRALETMAERTGGIAFFPRSLEEVDSISSAVARDIRNQYTIGYKPTTPKSVGGYRSIRVDAKARGFGKLTVRTRSGYYAGQEQATGGGN